MCGSTSRRAAAFTYSNWQFLNSPRLRKRIQPWTRAGLTADQVDPGDYLLDWRRGGEGLRYVHHFSPEELAELAAETGFRVIDDVLVGWRRGKSGAVPGVGSRIIKPDQKVYTIKRKIRPLRE